MSDKPDPRDVLDSLVRDACAQQSAVGLIPEPETAQRYMAGIMNGLDRKEAERKPAPVSTTKKEGAKEREYERRAGEGRQVSEFQVKKTPSQLIDVKRAKSKIRRLLLRRVRLLMAVPEWHARFKQVNPLAANGSLGRDRQRHANELYWQIIRDSERVFGPWNKELAPKAFSFNPASSTPR